MWNKPKAAEINCVSYTCYNVSYIYYSTTQYNTKCSIVSIHSQLEVYHIKKIFKKHILHKNTKK